MSLFKRSREKKVQFSHDRRAKQKEIPLKSFRFVQSKSFRGFKRVHLTSYGYKPIQDNINAIKKDNPLYKISKSNTMNKSEEYLTGKKIYKYTFDFKDADIEIREVRFEAFTEDEYNRGFIILANGKHIGTLFASSYPDFFNKIIRGEIDAVYVRIEGGDFKVINNPGSGAYNFDKFSENFSTDLFVHLIE